MRPTFKWLLIGFAAVLAWALFLVTSSSFIQVGGLQPPSLELLAKPRMADFRWPLVDLAEKPVDLSQFKGQPILLNIWATWCGPCLEEMPSIARLAENPLLKEKGVVFLCVSTDKSASKLQNFMKGSTWKMTVLRSTSIPPIFMTDGIPATFLIAPDGQIVSAELGASRWDDKSVIDFLAKLAKPVNPAPKSD
jgi:thiol-disulfide isomerase/thioredoxin